MPATVHKDLAYLSRQAKESLKTHIESKLPNEYQKCIVGINQVLKTCWNIVNKDTTDDKTKLQATAIINDSYKYLMDLTTNGIVVTDAIKYVTQKTEQLNTLQMLDKRIEAMGVEVGEDKTTNG